MNEGYNELLTNLSKLHLEKANHYYTEYQYQLRLLSMIQMQLGYLRGDNVLIEKGRKRLEFVVNKEMDLCNKYEKIYNYIDYKILSLYRKVDENLIDEKTYRDRLRYLVSIKRDLLTNRADDASRYILDMYSEDYNDYVDMVNKSLGIKQLTK